MDTSLQPQAVSAEEALRAAQALSASLDAERSSISKNKLKKMRQKRSKLVKQVCMLAQPGTIVCMQCDACPGTAFDWACAMPCLA